MAERILLVEDNVENAELAGFLLEEAGFAVTVARTAEEALAALADPPGVVLMDMDPPGSDGLTLVARLRHDPRHARLPIVALRAHAMRGDRERFLDSGCTGYIPKPIDVGSFVAEVARYLEVSRGR